MIRKVGLDFGFCVYPDAGFNSEYIDDNLYVIGCQCIVFLFPVVATLGSMFVCVFE